MSFEGHNDLYPAIEAVLKVAESPLTCHQIYDVSDVRRHAPSVNRVSDYLSVLFRKGKVSRVQVPPETGTRARYAYLWKEKKLPEWLDQPDVQTYQPKVLVDRPNLYITDGGEFIKIELPSFSVTIKAK